MELSVREAAVVLGKSERMVRHLAQTGKIPCKRSGGRWVFDREALVASSPEQTARHAQEAGVIRERLEAAVRSAAPPASGAPPREAWYSVRTMRAFTQADEALASIEDLVEQRPEAGPPLVGASTALTGSATNSCTPLMAAFGRLGPGQPREVPGVHPRGWPRPIRRELGA